jgi:hypothetical protein
MKKKDFELIASVLKYRIITLDDNTIAKVLVKDFANNLSDLYPRFDKQKFLQACGVEMFDSKKFEKINGYKPSYNDKRWFETRKQEKCKICDDDFYNGHQCL